MTRHQLPFRIPFITLALAAGLLFDCLTVPVRADILYVSNGGNATIERFTGDGLGSIFAGASAGLIGLAFDGAGNLYGANPGNTIEKFTPGGVGSVFANSGLGIPEGLAFDSAGNLYAANLGADTIEKFSPTGTDLGAFATSGLSNPVGLAFDGDGNLYAANSESGTVEKFSPAGSDLGAFASGLRNPRGLAFDSAGNLYVANNFNSTIEKFTSGGVGSVFVSSGLSNPLGLAFDSADNLYAVNGGSGTIKKFSPTGLDLGVFADFSSGANGPQFLAFTNDAGEPLPLANQVPEPSTGVMLLSGLGPLASSRRCGRRSAG